jgi:choline monooxygenase
VVRDEEGRLRGYHNVCRHRAGPLAPDGESACEGRLVCRYHGWAYALDGRLAAARDFGRAEGFDPRDYALFPLACESWNGFVFVNADAKARPLAREYEALDERIARLSLKNLKVVHRASHPIRCNWKTYVENYLEGYHVPLIHPALNASGDFNQYDVEIVPPAIVHRVATKNDAAVAGLWAWTWPCLAINVYADGVLMERMTPTAHDRVNLDYIFLASPQASQADIARSIEASLVTTREDIAICEAVQVNLEAGIYRAGRLSPKHEGGVAWFQAQVRAGG